MTAPKQPMDHQRKQPHTRSGKPGTPIQRAIAAYRNRSVLTVEGYLASVGASRDLIRKYRSAFGRKLAAAHRAATGTEPQRGGLDVRGHRLVRVGVYSRDVLAAAAKAYKRTAELLANASAAALIGA